LSGSQLKLCNQLREQGSGLLLSVTALEYMPMSMSFLIYQNFQLTENLYFRSLARHAVSALGGSLTLQASDRNNANQMFIDAYMTGRVRRIDLL
jgi:hypothetical protein